MKNRFFHLALGEAANRIGKPVRLLRLAAQTVSHLGKVDRKQFTMGRVRERVFVIGRMVTAYARGYYRGLPLKAILSLAAALIYFINPFDLVPDTLVGIGLTDDFAVITWVYNTFANELSAFQQWENSQQVSPALL